MPSLVQYLKGSFVVEFKGLPTEASTCICTLFTNNLHSEKNTELYFAPAVG